MTIEAAMAEKIGDRKLAEAYAAATVALAKHGDTYDTLRDLAVEVVDAAAPILAKDTGIPKAPTPGDIHAQRTKFLKALIAQARWESANGKGAEKGMYDSEISRAADWLETLL